jgi:FkbM family methyltransferase
MVRSNIKGNIKEILGWHLPLEDKHFADHLLANKQRFGQSGYQTASRRHSFTYIKHKKGSAIDIGGHVGFFSKDLVQKFKHVYVFEPVEIHRQCFCKNIQADNFTLYECALGNYDGKTTIVRDLHSSGDSHLKPNCNDGDIEIHRLDFFELWKTGQIPYIKIDAEGMELDILKGAEQTLRETDPLVVIEQKKQHALRYGNHQYAAQTWLLKQGYKIRGKYVDDIFLSK